MLKFQPFTSFAAVSFWSKLASLKLDVLQLNSEPVSVTAFLSPSGNAKKHGQDYIGGLSKIELNEHSFNSSSAQSQTKQLVVKLPGLLYNTNTMEEFKEMDRVELLEKNRNLLWDQITSGKVDQAPELLNSIILTTFANLKSHQYYYFIAFPAFNLDVPPQISSNKPVLEVFDPVQWSDINGRISDFIKNTGHGYFLLDEDNLVLPLSDWERLKLSNSLMIGFVDGSGLPEYPSWALKNFLVWVLWKLLQSSQVVESIRILCYREVYPEAGTSNSRVFDLIPPSFTNNNDIPLKMTGWEKNRQGKVVSKFVDLAPLLDASILAETAMDLNLRLMKWRQVPNLDLEKIKSFKCLLLGAGTLGCNVSRGLMGWGVRHVTFVDNGRISYSNPTRQSLYLFEDCAAGGSEKAECAAKRLNLIFPGMRATGVKMNIPMPGHVISSETKKDYETLKQLINDHDLIFLLTDSRESRWLPTVLGKLMKKLVINAALGFDSFLVMRHGGMESNLGCYYCSDVVAPGDSLKDRTLDQQCTVTRPGISSIASSMAVELAISLLLHPLGANAPITSDMLGQLPHQIRGFLGDWKNYLIEIPAYGKCIACSQQILSMVEQEDYSFVERVLQTPAMLESIVGLDQLKQECEAVDMIEWEEEEEE